MPQNSHIISSNYTSISTITEIGDICYKYTVDWSNTGVMFHQCC